MQSRERLVASGTSQPVEGDALLDELMARPVEEGGRRAAQGIVLGTLAELGEGTAPRVHLDGMGAVQVLCSLVPLCDADVGRTVALGFSGTNLHQAVILGLVWEPGQRKPSATSATGVAGVASADGRVVIESAKEIELRCGESALVLSADGRIQLRGHYITSHASATQRILGGSVNVN